MTVDAYRVFAQIADPTKLQAIYKGEKAAEFRVGMKVSVTMGEKSYAGDIVMTPATVPTDAPPDLQRAVLVEVPHLPPEVTQGSVATVTLVKAHKGRIITRPAGCRYRLEGRNFVQVIEGGIKKDRSVELGLQTDTLVEVMSGLASGDQVVYQ